MLGTPPPGYNASAVNQQNVGQLATPGTQGTSVLGPSRVTGAAPQLPAGGSPVLSSGGIGTSSYLQPSTTPMQSSLPNAQPGMPGVDGMLPGMMPPAPGMMGMPPPNPSMQAMTQALQGRGY